MRLRVFAGVAVLAVLAGCASRGSAPVIDRTSPSGRPSTPPAAAPSAAAAPAAPSGAAAQNARGLDARAETYTVRRGDTLYGIALDSGHGYREIAEWNNLPNPNLIREGQVLRLTPPQGAVQARAVEGRGVVESRPLDREAQASPARDARDARVAAAGDPVKNEPRAVKLPYTDENLALLSRDQKPAAPLAQAPTAKPAAIEAKPAAPEPKPAAPLAADTADDDEKIDWGWPTAGRVLAAFSESSNKGLDIGGKAGQPVTASASGTVLYVGSGIRGYGKLIVVRHSRTYSTVYAHNSEILVKESQRVVKGQKIAEMGNSDTDQVKLHFEIRRLGKPTDPAKFLPDRAP